MKVCVVCGKQLPPKNKKYCSKKCRTKANNQKYKEYYKKYQKKRRKTRQDIIWNIFINGGMYYDDSYYETIQGGNP